MRSRFRATRRIFAAAALLLGATLALPPYASACSMCRCSDPVLSALGEGRYTYGGFQIAVDWNRLDQTQGSEGHEEPERGGRLFKHGGDFEEQVRNTVTATISYGWHERLTLVAQVPYSFNELTEEDEVQKADGVSDPLFFVYGRIWASKFEQGLGRRAWLWAVFSVKTPWGENDVTVDGERLDEHVQPGTGATNLAGGLSGLYLIDEKSSLYASAMYTGTGRNEFGYKYGDNVQANVYYDRKLNDWLDAVLEVNYLFAKRDQVDTLGLVDPDTGGNSLYLTPRVAVNVVRGLVARAAAQFPVWEDLNGVQDIKPAFSAGLTYVF
jgi:hypothetical protein